MKKRTSGYDLYLKHLLAIVKEKGILVETMEPGCNFFLDTKTQYKKNLGAVPVRDRHGYITNVYVVYEDHDGSIKYYDYPELTEAEVAIRRAEYEKNENKVPPLTIVDFDARKEYAEECDVFYNPFRHIREEKDVYFLTKVIFEKTEPHTLINIKEEPYRNHAEMLLLQSIMLAVWRYHPTEEQTFGNVLEILKKAQGANGIIDLVELDNYFENIRAKDADCLAAIQYENFKLCAKKHCARLVVSLATRLQIFNSTGIKSLTSKDTKEKIKKNIKEAEGKE